jgi:hypothetical protein
MSQQKQLLENQELTISQILRLYGIQFTQITGQYSDGQNGRCALGVIMSYYGWDGVDKIDAGKRLSATLNALDYTGIDEKLLIEMNDSGFSFDKIADYIDIAK